MPAKTPKPPGKGLTAQRAKLVKLLEDHTRFLALAGTLQPWTPDPRAPYPPMPYGGSGRQRYMPSYVWARERGRAMPNAGPEGVTDEQAQAYINRDPFVRGGLAIKTVKALVFLESFAPSKSA
jgi:hypothetical protein